MTRIGSDLAPMVAAPETGNGDAARLAGVKARLHEWEDALAARG